MKFSISLPLMLVCLTGAMAAPQDAPQDAPHRALHPGAKNLTTPHTSHHGAGNTTHRGPKSIHHHEPKNITHNGPKTISHNGPKAVMIGSPFQNLTHWEDASQSGGGPTDYSIQKNQTGATDGNVLVFEVNPYSIVRPMVKYNGTTLAGTHSWRVYVPLFHAGDISSIGSFIYANDYQEFDFECGYGSKTMRGQLKISNLTTSMACALTSQSISGNSWSTMDSTWTVISSETWHIFQLRMDIMRDDTWHVTWIIDGVEVKRSQQKWGPPDMKKGGFTPFCSLENIWWMGDYGNPPKFPTGTPRTPNTAAFDYYSFIPV
ncbi:hypothetical protein BC937DRAFT_88253 [Endogone sp. FLAS-F59071]|nr:hypothetical protein BC937DRAFT_88253 [Endogone sp. FLAS-F59071]|eukprot:RUS18867.1 hypothetical protein BC937DRAFT_88253 [Endogone sp. FLAS-F59071]